MLAAAIIALSKEEKRAGELSIFSKLLSSAPTDSSDVT